MEVDSSYPVGADPEELPDTERNDRPHGRCEFCNVVVSDRKHMMTCVARKHATAARKYRKMLELKTAENLLLRHENERLRYELASIRPPFV